MEWELEWIWNNRDQYGCDQHAIAVMGNIKKRYRIIELNKQIKELMIECRFLLTEKIKEEIIRL